MTLNTGHPAKHRSLPFPPPQGGGELVEAARRANLAARADLIAQERRRAVHPVDETEDRVDRLERDVEALIATIAELAVRS